MALREPAWRVFAAELTASLHEERGTGERAASYLLSPYGARMNRVLVAGILSSPEAIGRDPSQPFWRARLVDPTGTVAVTAGVFQPRAMAQLQSVPGPRSAVVVGKVHLYRGSDGTGYVSVRAEAIRSVDDPALREFLADALEQSFDRLALVERIRGTGPDSDAALRSDGVPGGWIRAARDALARYPSIDRDAYRASLSAALEVVQGRRSIVPPAPAGPSSVRVTPAEPPAASARAPPSAEERAAESEFLDALDELVEASSDGYADLKEIVQLLAEHGLSSEHAEDILDRLQEAGVVEEPIVGKLRRP